MDGILRSSVAVTTLLILALSGWAGRPAAGQFSSAVRQVEVYASVTDGDGRPVRELTQRDFTVLEDDAPQLVTTFAASEFPASVALAVDRSSSMAGPRLAVARTAGRVFVSSLRPNDRVMIIGIGSEVDVLAPFSADRAAAHDALDRLDAWGATSLHDAIVKSLDLLNDAQGRRAIVLLSDGQDRYSRASAADVAQRVRQSDVLVYPVSISKQRPALFAELASLSGGRSFHLRGTKELEATLKAIAEHLRWQYLLGYTPSRPWRAGEAEWRNITVRVRPGLDVRARAGYTTP
jgi:Ca-activated chloride channel family protein